MQKRVTIQIDLQEVKVMVRFEKLVFWVKVDDVRKTEKSIMQIKIELKTAENWLYFNNF